MLKINKPKEEKNVNHVGADASVCPNSTKKYQNCRGTGHRAQSTKTNKKNVGVDLDQPAAITLVALIITIIILIILAGVSLNLALGQNGIFVKSKEAVDKYKDEAQKEQNTLENIYQDMPGDDLTTGGTLQPGVKSTSTEKDNYKDTNNATATIPAGFTVSSKSGESTVDTGLVVIDENNNEWVWVPVSSEQLGKMYTEGTEDIKLYNQDTVTTRKYSNLYDFSSTERTKKITSLLPNETSYREPSLTTYDTGSSASNYASQAGFGSPQDMAQKFVNDYKAMMESIDKYEGFYIGRYELGKKDSSSGEYVVQKYKTAANNISWYKLYKACRDLKPSSNNDVVTTMIWGTQWDQTLLWLHEAGDKKSWSDIASDSESWGNYNDVTFEYQESEDGEKKTKNKNETTLVPTGSSDHNKANNIYDLAGNLREWTQEAYDTRSRVMRGGYYGHYSYAYPTSERNNGYPDNTGGFFGSRPTLYIVEQSSGE